MRTILVIDDHVATCTTMCLILKGFGYKAMGASTVADAERQFRDYAIDMVVVDHGLPGITGADLASKFKAIRNVLILMLSGNPDLEDKPAGVDVLLRKPQLVPELMAAINSLFCAKTA
jgi:DNA-binding response OmpR family regulator